MVLTPSDFCVIAAVNDDEIFNQCLALSPAIADGRLEVTTIRDAKSMAEAYNRGLELTTAPICIFVHQDVYLPDGWLEDAIKVLRGLDEAEPDWMVAGPFGIEADGSHCGRVWDVNMNMELRAGLPGPKAVQSLDELLLIVKRQPDFRLDPDLPHFHMYGTDLVQTAWAMGKSAWAVELPVVHNNRPWASLGGGFRDAYNYVRRKWRSKLPIYTPVCAITYNPLALWRVRWRRRKVSERGEGLLAHAPDVAKRAGYERPKEVSS